MKKYVVYFFFLMMSVINSQEVLDKIVAVVDNEIILKSELEYRVAAMAAQRNLNPNDDKLKKAILDELIAEKLLFAQAEIDSITVSDDEVTNQLDYQLNYFTQQYGSREKVEEIYGMSMERIRRELRDDVKKNLMVQKVQQKNFDDIQVTEREVREFYKTYKDSIGLIPERFEISHIFINPVASDKIKEEARAFAQTLLDSIKKGADFAELAKEYSMDPGSKSVGGDLGYVKRGAFYSEFESAAFALAENEISKLVESPVGYHIIQLLDRRGESIHTRHILIKPTIDDDADLNAIEFLGSIRDSIINNENTFEYYAQKYSDDDESAKFGGDLGKFEVGQLDKSLLETVYKLDEGEISFPKRLDIDNSTYGFHIVLLRSRTPEHKPTIENDMDELKQIAIFNKKQKLYAEWLNKLKENIYWEIRL
ncbi:MAG: peptidylprolyl isomerase [Ignavibacteria bacterium]|jgi:peptidyl-prolyl cis-trans isomerase SurA